MTCQESQHTVLMHMARHTNWNVLSHHLLFSVDSSTVSAVRRICPSEYPTIALKGNVWQTSANLRVLYPDTPCMVYCLQKLVILQVNVGEWCTMSSGFWLANRQECDIAAPSFRTGIVSLDWFGHQFTTGHGGCWSLSLVNNSNGAVDNGLTNVNNDRWKMMAY